MMVIHVMIVQMVHMDSDNDGFDYDQMVPVMQVIQMMIMMELQMM